MPKRKTSPNTTPISSPTKRKMRSTAVKEQEVGTGAVSTPTKRRGRPPGIRPSDLPRALDDAVNGHATRQSLRKHPIVLNGSEEVPDSEEDGNETPESDELNLSPRKQRDHDVESQTPQRELSRKRMFIHSVEITTPSKLNRSGIASARPTSPSPAQRRSQRQAPKPGPSTPRKLSPASPSRTVRTSPAKFSPRKEAAGDAALPGIPSFHLHECLMAQKAAVLAALRNPPSTRAASGLIDEEDEPGDDSATLDQLRGLLAGTVERGEGNSCLVIGPRGSGKTRVRLLSYTNHQSSFSDIKSRCSNKRYRHYPHSPS